MINKLITEKELGAYRCTQLAPDHVLARLPGKDAVLLFNEPPGLGKTTLGHGLIGAALQSDFDLVVFVAPTRAILDELANHPDLGVAKDNIVVLKPRPRLQCGGLDAKWQEMERSCCSALAKDQLCGTCPHTEECPWPDQMEQIDENARLIVLTEQYLILNPNMVPALIRRASAINPLVILDEALFLTQQHTYRITRQELDVFADVLSSVSIEHPLGQKAVDRWVRDVSLLLDQDIHVDHQPRIFANNLEHAILAVQHHGQTHHGKNYRHLAHDLSLLNSPVTTGQWQLDGCFEIAVRVDLGTAQAIVLAPDMEAALVEERLHRSVVVANPNHMFRHSGTKAINIRDGIGAARSMHQRQHRKRIVDTFSALTLRNSLLGKRTVLVTKKCFMDQIATEIEEFAANAQLPLKTTIAKAGDPLDELGPWQVPIISYGIVGINSLQHFDAIYALGSYHITDDHLNDVYNRDLPPDRRYNLRIRTKDRHRTVEAADGSFSTRFHARRARALHRTLERRVVLQAVGRARPFTSATEVILFQQDDFSDCFGEVETYDTLGAFRTAMGLPTEAEIKRAALGDQMRLTNAEGASYRDLSREFNCSTSTAHKALQMPGLNVLLVGSAV